MHWYIALLAIFAIAVTVLAWRVPRAAMWVGLGALSFCASGWWHDSGLPYGAAFGAFTDIAVVFALYAYARLLYELVFWGCFILMMLIDLLLLTHVINSHWDFAVGLEVANWLALLSIGLAGLADRAKIGLAWVAIRRTSPSWRDSVLNRALVAVSHLARST